MSYLYPNYNDEPDAEVHIWVFLTTWQANHVSQKLTAVNIDASKIAKFGLSLEGQATNWYSQHNQGDFDSFDQLSETFVDLAHHCRQNVFTISVNMGWIFNP